MQSNLRTARSGLAAAILLLAAFVLGPAVLAENKPAKYTAILIWGTDGPKPEDKELKDVDANLVEKFTKIFKWKNYYEVKRADFELKAGEPKKVELSQKCEVRLHLTEKEGLEVELLGEQRSVYKGKQAMPLKDLLILAGDDKNATAWFVVLKPE
jgi:hypothetical protein